MAGLDFNSGKPISLADGKIQTIEGCATICDKYGHLLFYTDGIIVYDRRHIVMQNGNGLFGNQSTTQAALIIPYIGDTNVYYIFTLDKEARVNGLCYSLVDMRLNGGYGDVYKKNIGVYSPSTEKMTAIPCANKSGYWLITHDYGRNQFITYQINGAGISTVPVISKVGLSTSVAIGYMVASPDGKKIAIANYKMNDVELFDFDNATGKLSNAVKINSYTENYGLAFSADSKILYTSQCAPSGTMKSLIQQYDLNASNIAASAYLLNTDTAIRGAMALAPDGRIYVARLAGSFLDVINDPDKRGSKCGFVNEGMQLKSGYSSYGLPNFPLALYAKSKISYIIGCIGDPVIFRRINYTVTDSVSWDFGDPSSGKANIATTDSTGHFYSKTGTYTVILKSFYQGNSDTESVTFTINPISEIPLPKNPIICKGSMLQLSVKRHYYPAIWSDGSTDSIFITNAGKYWITAWTNACPQTDTINVTIFDPNDNSGFDTTICWGDTVKINLRKPGRTFLWQDKDTSGNRIFTKEGTYYVNIYTQCGIKTDTFKISVNKPLHFDFGRDTFLCQGSILNLSGPDSADLLWQDGSISPTYIVNTGGVYKVTASNACGVLSDSIKVSYYPALSKPRPIDTSLCRGASLKVNVTQKDCHYLWQDGSTIPIREFSADTLTYVNISGLCSTASDTISLKVIDPLKLFLGNDTVLCTGDSLSLKAPVSTNHVWQDGSKGLLFSVKREGIYWLTASNLCGTASDTIYVKYDNRYLSHLPKDTFLCQGDSIKLNAGSIHGIYLWADGLKGNERTIKDQGVYVLNFKNSCQHVYDSTLVALDSYCVCNLYTPDIFSPDDNGINDTWKPSYCSHYRSYYLQVFNRWGERVFDTEDITNGWGGFIKGSKAMEGMYFYMIALKDVHGKQAYKNGRFCLLRN